MKKPKVIKKEERGQLVSIRINVPLTKMLEKLRAECGYTFTDSMRQGIRVLYRKEFPLYNSTKGKIDKETDPKRYCEEELGGVYSEDNGKSICTITRGAIKETRYL